MYTTAGLINSSPNDKLRYPERKDFREINNLLKYYASVVSVFVSQAHRTVEYVLYASEAVTLGTYVIISSLAYVPT